MGFRYQLRLADGGDFGEAEYASIPGVGEVVWVSGARRVRVTAVVPFERVEEFVDRPVYGILEVEPVE